MINGAATLILLSLDLLASILNEIWPYDVPRCHTTLNGRKKKLVMCSIALVLQCTSMLGHSEVMTLL